MVTSLYFAGPELFRPDYAARVELIGRLCQAAGLKALLPQVDASGPKDSASIFRENIALIERADGLVASLDPFRGPLEPDSGTVFECGYGFARGKFVIGLISDGRDMLSKAAEGGSLERRQGQTFWDGLLVEDFGLPLNLMLSHSLSAICSSLPEAIDLARRWGPQAEAEARI